MEYTKISSDTQWENTVGYSRLVKAGGLIEVSGTVASENGNVIGEGDAYKQTRFILGKIQSSLKLINGDLTNVVRTRIYVTDISLWAVVGKAHGEFFQNIKPATTMVEVSRLIDDAYLVEIEATAMV